jgi:hypothetical protein
VWCGVDPGQKKWSMLFCDRHALNNTRARKPIPPSDFRSIQLIKFPRSPLPAVPLRIAMTEAERRAAVRESQRRSAQDAANRATQPTRSRPVYTPFKTGVHASSRRGRPTSAYPLWSDHPQPHAPQHWRLRRWRCGVPDEVTFTSVPDFVAQNRHI